MPIIPNLIEKILFLVLKKGPAPILDLMGGAMFCAMGHATSLGIFEMLQARPLSSAEIARRIQADHEGVHRLLEFLSVGGYLRKKSTTFANSAMTNRWLVRSSPGNVIDFLSLWQGVLFELWHGGLEQTLHIGHPALHLHDWLPTQPQLWTTYNAAMTSMALLPAEEVARRVNLNPSASRLLDVGGSHGLYSAAFCRKYPKLQATIFDTPDALPAAAPVVAEFEGRVLLRAGDIRKDDPGSGYDVALLSNILHYFPRPQVRALLASISAALAPGGLMIINEQLVGPAFTPVVAAYLKLTSLNYFTVLGGDVFALGEVACWITAAGFGNLRKLRLRTAAGQLILLAHKMSST